MDQILLINTLAGKFVLPYHNIDTLAALACEEHSHFCSKSKSIPVTTTTDAISESFNFQLQCSISQIGTFQKLNPIVAYLTHIMHKHMKGELTST